MSSALWLPPTVSRELQDHTAKHTAEVLEMLEPAGVVEREWNRVLRQKDPRLMMVRAKENAHAPGLLPGYYHLMMVSEGAPPTFMPILGTDGEFVEPSHRTLSWLESADLQNPQAIRDREVEMKRLQERKEREKQNETEEMVDEAQERWAAVTRTQVSMNPDAPWSQNQAGQRAAKGHARDKRRTEE